MLDFLTKKGNKTELQLGYRFCYELSCSVVGYMKMKLSLIWCLCCEVRKPAVVMIVGVNGGGKTTSLGEIQMLLFRGNSGVSVN